ncbi:hypothetical protein C4561_00750 [candidate division WWE3 bacterium]|jgi:hypothetical protein|uniref:Uncharacterized protein n=1 Tax=candidate division WWE3 bacterium TaxID=2053526 RepID=A0A3A4ZFW4_UNCKA|nr:MAG: hypothetical protein C4561_00750 [candidate division WWE3 bacterium]
MNKNKTFLVDFGTGLLAFTVYMLIGIFLQVFFVKNAYYCPFDYGACGPVGIEYTIPWIINRLFWPVEFALALLFSLPGASLSLL